jgi:hypothetical protein
MASKGPATKDYLEQDPPVRGQNYVCMSFVSPEDVIENKHAFATKKFLKSFCESSDDAFKKIIEQAEPSTRNTLESIRSMYSYVFDSSKVVEAYEKFTKDNSEEITREFDEKNDNRTSIRGIKIRGCYETLHEARNRGETLIKKDPNFHIFVGEVGCWCPWSPNPDDIKDEVFAEGQLNDLVREYKENIEQRQTEFERRKNDMLKMAVKDGKRGVAEERDPDKVFEEEEIITVGGISSAMSEQDPWIEKIENKNVV